MRRQSRKNYHADNSHIDAFIKKPLISEHSEHRFVSFFNHSRVYKTGVISVSEPSLRPWSSGLHRLTARQSHFFSHLRLTKSGFQESSMLLRNSHHPWTNIRWLIYAGFSLVYGVASFWAQWTVSSIHSIGFKIVELTKTNSCLTKAPLLQLFWHLLAVLSISSTNPHTLVHHTYYQSAASHRYMVCIYHSSTLAADSDFWVFEVVYRTSSAVKAHCSLLWLCSVGSRTCNNDYCSDILAGSGTILCGVASSMEMLIAARAVAGMGGGGYGIIKLWNDAALTVLFAHPSLMTGQKLQVYLDLCPILTQIYLVASITVTDLIPLWAIQFNKPFTCAHLYQKAARVVPRNGEYVTHRSRGPSSWR